MAEVVKLKGDRAENTKSLAIMNDKGGCGKTSLSLALGLHVARLGYNVLFVDMDQQSNLSKRLGLSDDGFRDKRINQVFKYIDKDKFGRGHMDIPVIVEYPRLYKIVGVDEPVGSIGLIAGSHVAAIEAAFTLQKIEADKFNRVDPRNLFERFVDAIESYRTYFDYIIIDTGPELEGNILCQLAARTADEILVPIDGVEAADGLRHLMNWLYKETSSDKGVEARPGVLFAMMKYQSDTGSVRDLVDSEDEGQLKNVVHRALKSSLGDYVCDAGIKEKASMRNAVYAGFGRRNAYEEICTDILERIGMTRPSIFKVWETKVDELQEKLTEINKAALNRQPIFSSPAYVALRSKNVKKAKRSKQ